MAGEQEHWLSCRDAMGRPSNAQLIVRRRELVVRVPPGEAAVFGVDQVDQAEQLRMALVLGIERLREQRRR